MGVCSELEQKVDKMAADLTKRQLEREATALEYKRCVYECFCMTRHDIILLDLPCLSFPHGWSSLIEQKVAKMEDEVFRKLEESEDTVREYKR